MAVTLASLQTEARVFFGESTTVATSGIFTDTFVIAAANMFYDEYEDQMELKSNPFTYVIGATATSVAFSTLSSSIITINKIEVLDGTSGLATGEVPKRPQGDSYGFFEYNGFLHFNTSAGSATSLQIWGTRKATRATATSSNVDIHADSERAVFIPFLLSKGYARAKQFSSAEGYRATFEHAFKQMKKKITRRANPEFTTIETSEDYEPLTG